MHICNCGHECIVHNLKHCPLCNLRKHNDIVHDFIESKGSSLVSELVAYQHRNSSVKEERRITDRQHRQLAIAALWQVLGRQPVGVELTESIMASFESELQQQSGA